MDAERNKSSKALFSLPFSILEQTKKQGILRENENQGEMIDMTIRIGENPEHRRGWNKYIETNGDGWRGIVVAFNKDHKRAIIKGESRRGKLLVVKEIAADEYPIVTRSVKTIPRGYMPTREMRKER